MNGLPTHVHHTYTQCPAPPTCPGSKECNQKEGGRACNIVPQHSSHNLSTRWWFVAHIPTAWQREGGSSTCPVAISQPDGFACFSVWCLWSNGARSIAREADHNGDDRPLTRRFPRGSAGGRRIASTWHQRQPDCPPGEPLGAACGWIPTNTTAAVAPPPPMQCFLQASQLHPALDILQTWTCLHRREQSGAKQGGQTMHPLLPPPPLGAACWPSWKPGASCQHTCSSGSSRRA